VFIYAIGNIKGYYDLFEEALSLVDLSGDNKLVFVGEYTRVGPDGLKILDKMMALEAEYGKEKVIVLHGNEEEQAILGEVFPTSFDKNYLGKDSKYLNWFKTLKHLYVYGGYCFTIPCMDEKERDESNELLFHFTENRIIKNSTKMNTANGSALY
jgi:serine/threonine protein phosphatase 1